MSDDELRTTFDAVAAQYADVRPGYPDELFDALQVLIDRDFGGYVDKHFAMTLTVARAR